MSIANDAHFHQKKYPYRNSVTNILLNVKDIQSRKNTLREYKANKLESLLWCDDFNSHENF